MKPTRSLLREEIHRLTGNAPDDGLGDLEVPCERRAGDEILAITDEVHDMSFTSFRWLLLIGFGACMCYLESHGWIL